MLVRPTALARTFWSLQRTLLRRSCVLVAVLPQNHDHNKNISLLCTEIWRTTKIMCCTVNTGKQCPGKAAILFTLFCVLHLISGLNDIVSDDLLSMFDEHELEVSCGLFWAVMLVCLIKCGRGLCSTCLCMLWALIAGRDCSWLSSLCEQITRIHWLNVLLLGLWRYALLEAESVRNANTHTCLCICI